MYRAVLTLCGLLLLASPAAAEVSLFKADILIQATVSNNVDKVGDLLARGRFPDPVDGRGRTPLILAASAGYEDIVDALLRHQARPARRDQLGNTALHYAAQNNYPEIVGLLVEHGADVNIENSRGVTPLIAAASAGHVAVVQRLLDAKANPAKTDYTGRTAMMWAERNNRREVQQVLRARGAGE